MFKRLHLSLRFLVPLIAAMLALAYAAVPLVDTLTLRWFVRDLDSRSFLIGETLGESLIEQVRNSVALRCTGPVVRLRTSPG